MRPRRHLRPTNNRARGPLADDPTLWHQARDLDALSLDQWDELFLPGVSAEAEVGARQYVLHPVDGDGRYERRARELVQSQETPHQDIEMTWPKFALCLTHKQARSVTLLLQELSRHQVRGHADGGVLCSPRP